MTPHYTALAADMRLTCSRPGDYQQANVWASEFLHVHLSRHGQAWKMELSDVTPIPFYDVHAWVHAFGAPEGTPVTSAVNGLIAVAQWDDAAFDPARPVGAVHMAGGAR